MRVIVPFLVISRGSGNYTMPDVTRAFDGLLFIERLSPATRIK